MVSELDLKIFAQLHVLKHLCHLIYLVKTAFHFQLLEHDLLSFHGKQRLIEESLGEMLHVCFHESVTSVQAAEESDYSIESLLSLFICYSLEARCQFLVGINCEIKWRLTALIHEVLERRVTTLLELHAVVETLLKHGVHLGLQVKQLLRESNWIFEEVLVFHDSLATLLDVRIHLLNNETKSLRVSLEDHIHQVELFKSRVKEHVLAASLFFDHRLSFFGYQLVLHDLEHFGLGFWLEPKVSVIFFVF